MLVSVTACGDGPAVTLECASVGEVGACVDIWVFYLQLRGEGLVPFPEDRMADSQAATDKKDAPKAGADPTAEAPARDFRLFPGGRLDAPDVGVNAFDRDDLPSQGLSPTLDFQDSPDDEER